MKDFFLDAIAEAIFERIKNHQRREVRVLDIDKAAKYVSLSKDALRDVVAAGKVRTVRITHKVQFDIQDLDRLIDESKP